MYSYEDRIRAVKFYINCGYNATYTVLKLGYPDVTNLNQSTVYRPYNTLRGNCNDMSYYQKHRPDKFILHPWNL